MTAVFVFLLVWFIRLCAVGVAVMILVGLFEKGYNSDHRWKSQRWS